MMDEVHFQFNPVEKRPEERDSEEYRGHAATFAEYHLSKLLEEAGYCVDGDARMAFEISPRKKKAK